MVDGNAENPTEFVNTGSIGIDDGNRKVYPA